MKNKTIKYIIAALLLQVLTVDAWAQAGEAGADPNFYNRFLSNGLLIFSGLAILGAILALVNLLNAMVKMQQIRIFQEQGMEAYLEETKKPSESIWKRLYKRATHVVPVEKEEDILFEHEYDGIRELDNSLPPWWVWMFYLSIGFAIVYMTYYHFAGIGLSSTEQYEQEVEKAQAAVQAYLSRQADQIDENNVTPLTDDQALMLGKTIYETNCVACHGALGEGGVGPNLTDEYWLHGGGIQNIFKTIKYGVPEKGMISWKSQLRASDMQRVASYILTMEGTNPPNAKEPQGEKYQVGNETPVDSTGTDQTIGMIK